MEQKTNDMAQELSESLEHIMDENMAERRKQLYRHKMPTDHSLRALLLAMTKSELDDIRYNLHVTGASSLKKAELAECLVPAILAFAKRWLPTIVDEEYGCFSHLLQKGGLSTELRDDDTRLDYLRGLGLVACGVQVTRWLSACRMRCRSFSRAWIPVRTAAWSNSIRSFPVCLPACFITTAI